MWQMIQKPIQHCELLFGRTFLFLLTRFINRLVFLISRHSFLILAGGMTQQSQPPVTLAKSQMMVTHRQTVMLEWKSQTVILHHQRQRNRVLRRMKQLTWK